MDRDPFFRRVLWTSAAFNLGGALLFAFPASLGQVVGLPAEVPGIYRAFVALFVVLFGGSYAWLAAQPTIDRAFVAFAAIGKASAFALILLFWIAGEGSLRGVAAGAGDLVFAGIFAWWLGQTARA